MNEEKKKKPRSRQPVMSFGPELMAALLKGSREKVEFNFPDQKGGKFFQARIHALRAAMRAENHPNTNLVYRARTNFIPGERTSDPSKVLIFPNDSQFKEAIAAAGVEVVNVEGEADPLSQFDGEGTLKKGA